ncbi:hypothetical protein H0W26_02425 [Candidatus Dependentiae bacterium]|nr:hypothetical protein [Candidatus Dependentiae bacterium]
MKNLLYPLLIISLGTVSVEAVGAATQAKPASTTKQAAPSKGKPSEDAAQDQTSSIWQSMA